jgi:hypothetical protein
MSDFQVIHSSVSSLKEFQRKVAHRDAHQVLLTGTDCIFETRPTGFAVGWATQPPGHFAGKQLRIPNKPSAKLSNFILIEELAIGRIFGNIALHRSEILPRQGRCRYFRPLIWYDQSKVHFIDQRKIDPLQLRRISTM